MSNTEHLVNVMVEAFIAVVESGVDLVPVVAGSTLAAKIAPFIKQFPGRLVNVDIAEQSIVGAAAGLALGGKMAVAYNAAPFLISRANEQIKVDVCYNSTSVKLFGLNAGASYNPLVSTHHAINDLAMTRGSGDIQIFAPSTPRECRQIIDYALAYQDPIYIRLDGKALPELLDKSYRFVPGVMLTLREGEGVALVTTGSTVHEVVEATQRLADLGIQAKVISMPSIRPCDAAALLAALRPCGSVITVEGHNVNGGLGSLVAEVPTEMGMGIALQRLGIPDGEYAAAADHGQMRQYRGFNAAVIVALVQKRDWRPKRLSREARMFTAAMHKA